MILRSYQKKGLRFLIQKKKAALFWEMRLGKTVTAMKAVKVLRAYPCLIVAPYSAFTSWINEVGEESIIQIIGPRKRRLASVAGPEREWYLINSEGFLSVPEISNYEWGSVILDESTYIKNPKSRISKYYTGQFKHVPVKYVLAGIPDPESRLDFIQQLIFLDALDINYWRFVQYYCHLAGYEYVLKKKGKELLSKVLSDRADFLKLKEVNLGAEKIYMTHNVELSKKARRQYDKIMDSFELNDDNITIFKPVTLVWARRLLGGFVERRFLYKEKLSELKHILLEHLSPATPKIIFATYLQEIYLISSALKGLGKIGTITGATKLKKRFELVRKFQAGKINLLICQPGTVKHGLNLSAASEIIFYSTPEGLETRYQCEARAMLRKTLTIIDLVCRDTLEEDIIKSLRLKEKQSAMYRRIIKRLQK